MLTALLTISRNTFTESIRQPIYMVLLGLGVLVLVMSMLWSAHSLEDDTQLHMTTSLGGILLGGLVLGSLIASGVLAREIDNRTVLTVISKPIGRPAFVLGKYLGVAGAVGLALWIWSMVFLLTMRHKVMSAASDPYDMPVIVFGSLALVLALVIAVWGNYFYKWIFTASFVRAFGIGVTLAYLIVLMVNKQWEFQSIVTEFDPELAPITNYGEKPKSLVQVVIALLLVSEAVWLLTSLAVAVSTRLGHVMTLVVVAGVFALGVMSDWLFGRFADASLAADIAYRLTPNLQVFFLADALLMRNDADAVYVLTVTGYAALWIVAFCALGVALFQTRETG